MIGEAPDDPNGAMSLPATIADIFLALVGVVVLMLLSLAPAIRTPGGLVPRPFEIWRAELLLDGRPAATLVAEKEGLRLLSPVERLVSLDALLEDADLARELERIADEDSGVLLVITPQGQEAAFLFTALAGQLGLDETYHLRLDADCGYIRDLVLAATCRGHPAGASR